MATAIRGRGAAFDVQPVGEFSGPFNGPIAGIAAFIKDTVQGSCAGLLSLLGATHMTGAPTGFASLGSEIEGLNGIWQTIAANGLVGPVELIGGVALFLAARRTVARTLGLLGFIAFMAAYANGYTLPDILSAVSGALEYAAGILNALAPADVAPAPTG